MLGRYAIALLCVMTGSGCTHLEDVMVLGASLPAERLSPELSLVTWNVGKGRFSDEDGAIATDLQSLLDIHDIGCIQEFVPSLAPQAKGVFARSFQWWLGEEPNGVATFSNTETTDDAGIPVVSSWNEGWVLTPKMSLITTYQFQGTRLLVANVHALNFQPVFTYMLASQMSRIRGQVLMHHGPVIVCGDFNTWREDRLSTVRAAFNDFEMVSFSPDRRSRGGVFARLAGNASLALDHVFVKGLEVIKSEVLLLGSSDHRPLIVRLRISDN